jgi:hypothetical protein
MVLSRALGLAAVFSLGMGAATLIGAPAHAARYAPSELIAKARGLVGSSPAALQAITGLIVSANPQPVNAIGTGLGQVALICGRPDQAFSTEIQNAVSGSGNSALTLAFASVLGDKPIGALGGGVADGGGGGTVGSTGACGGQTNPRTGFAIGAFFGSSPSFTSLFTKNAGFNFFTSNSASAPGAPSNTTTITITTAGSVSPAQ